MCGIAGYFTVQKQRAYEEMEQITKRMINTLQHRGPDGFGVWIDIDKGICLGHRRLAIIDLSSNGQQPMISSSGRYVITFNGEIYNFQELRHELKLVSDISFRGYSDTEVMLAAFDVWGVEKALKRFIGMFAFALWDRQEHLLYLARDRMGEKPLYYGWMGPTFLFGSDLAALCAHPEFKKEIDQDVLSLYLRHQYVPAPYSIYKDIFKLPQGTYLSINLNEQFSTLEPTPYWSAEKMIFDAKEAYHLESEEEAIHKLDGLLRNVIDQQMISDVPTGVFLSGGIDSSTIAALMQQLSTQSVKTFTIGFNIEGYNEAVHAKEVANYLGTNHTELYVTPEQVLEVIPKLPSLYNEPFSDSSQIPTFLVSELARTKVTVSLSGDGGDELFGGYNRYYWVNEVWNKMAWAPSRVRRFISSLLTSVSPQSLDTMYSFFAPVFSGKWKQMLPGEKLYKLAEVITAESPKAMYCDLISLWKHPALISKGATEPMTIINNSGCWPDLENITEWMMYMDMMTYLPDDILVKVDRASMGKSLEVRAPFLDHRVVEFSWKLPLNMKMRNHQGKWILRQVLYQYVPKHLIERPKMGFSIPIHVWLRGPLREWAENLLDQKKLDDGGLFDSGLIRRKWEEHISGRYNWQHYLWNILMFQAWIENGQNKL